MTKSEEYPAIWLGCKLVKFATIALVQSRSPLEEGLCSFTCVHTITFFHF